MQHADEREQPSGGVGVHRHLAAEPLAQQFGAFVVQAAAPHVDRLDAARRSGADRLVVGVADQEVVLDDAPQLLQRQIEVGQRRIAGIAHLESEARAVDLQVEMEGPREVARRGEAVLLHQGVERGAPFVLDLRAQPQPRRLTEPSVPTALLAT